MHVYRFNITAAGGSNSLGGAPQETNYLGPLPAMPPDPVYQVMGYYRLPAKAAGSGREVRVVLQGSTATAAMLSVCVLAPGMAACEGR